MPSPFPGMDPYLESPELWPDVHGALNYKLRAALASVLPTGHIAKVDRHVWVQDPGSEERTKRAKPDTFIVESSPKTSSAVSSAAVLGPNTYLMFPSSKKLGNRFIRIVDRKDRHVVTVIGLPSPANKSSPEDRLFYLDKRKEYLAASTNLVELDLLRDGGRLPMGKPKPRPADYYIVVSRAAEFPRVGIWTQTVRDSLPTIPVPLKADTPDVSIDLRSCLDQAYDEARHDREIGYNRPSHR